MKKALVKSITVAGLAAASVLALTSCNTAEVTNVWKAPDVTKFSFKKVMVLSVTSDGSARRTFEDSVVASMPQVQGIASYTVSVVATAATYRITATAIQTMARDVCETLSIDQAGVRSFTGPGGTEEVCWHR